jgi:hypothetical protein
VANPNIRIWTDTTIIRAYARWFAGLVAQGWDPYLVTLTFDELPGSMQAQIAQMHHAAMAVYSRLVTRMVRKPRSPSWASRLPRAVFAPDLPVPKRRTTPVQEPPANDGLHLHGVILLNGSGRLIEPLDQHFQRRTYLIGKLRPIVARRIDSDPGYVTAYALKGLKRSCFDTDHLLVLPRSLSELPHKVLRSA